LNWRVGVNIGAPVGWFPLGPREVFVPAYTVSRGYVAAMNRPHVAVTTVNVNVTNITYVNRNVPDAMTPCRAASSPSQFCMKACGRRIVQVIDIYWSACSIPSVRAQSMTLPRPEIVFMTYVIYLFMTYIMYNVEWRTGSPSVRVTGEVRSCCRALLTMRHCPTKFLTPRRQPFQA
jgi:hypothetical protein